MGWHWRALWHEGVWIWPFIIANGLLLGALVYVAVYR